MADTDLCLSAAPTLETGMLIHRPVNEVFRALSDPEVTTKFWFTKSTGKLAPGAEVRWTWEMYGASADVKVKEFEEDQKIVFEWGPAEAATTVKFTFEERGDDTYFQIKETGFTGEDGDAVAAWAIGSMGGFTQMIAGLKAYLEHNIILTIVADRFPDGHPT